SLRLAQGLPAGNQCRFPSLPAQHPTTASASGYWAATATGAVYSFGAAHYYGGMAAHPLNAPITGMTPPPTRPRHCLPPPALRAAPSLGARGPRRLTAPAAGMPAPATGPGYWVLASDGGVFSFGDAQFHGWTGAMRLNAPIIGMAATPTGHGYWLYASDGGV